jgi:DNA-nicking Smr family endonuclease
VIQGPAPVLAVREATLDLHGFRPADLGDVVQEYLRVALESGWTEVRIVHGRGRLVLARSVHALLSRHPQVEGFSLATEAWGGAGATWVRLVPGKKALGPDAASRITDA